MKKVFMAALLVVGMTAFAQEKEGKREGREKLTTEQKVDHQVKKLHNDLNLNDKQTEQVKALVTKQVQKREEKRKEIQESKDKKREEIRAEMQANQAAMASEMKKILTPEQFAKWEKNRADQIEKMKEKMADRKAKKE
eukprot:GDKJ01002680.1.p2 GENE.GDKJ01002680.1~~GDKJ01002680.1.p2  ORF type:complete len:138 (-),score=29.39 GDKJ01002680.1:342-755(-)